MIRKIRLVPPVIATALSAFLQAAAATESPPATVTQEVVVTATRLEENIQDIPASVQVIDAEAMKRMNAATMADVLKTAVGMDLQGGAFPGSAVKVNMRGLTTGFQSERILVLMDGRRINDPYQGNTEIALLPLDNVQRIEIVRGPASALYGSNAEGGVINIITRTGAQSPGTEVSASAGSFDTVRLVARHGDRKGIWDYLLTASYFDTAGYTDNSDGTDRDWTEWNLTANTGWKIGPDSTVRVRAGASDGEGTDENSDRQARTDYESVEYSLNWNPVRDTRLVAGAYRNAQRQEYDWRAGGRGIYRQYTLGGEVQQSLWVNDRHLASVGADARYDSVDVAEVLQTIDQSVAAFGVYVQDEMLLTEQWRLTAGLRNDYSEDYDAEWSPRLGLVCKPSAETEIYASFNQAHRAPSLSDRFVKVEYNGLLFEGNPNLKPETLTAFEIGGRRRFGNRVTTEAAAFHNHLKDMFDYILGSDGVFQNQNITAVTTYGAEAAVSWQITQATSAFLNYTHTEGIYDEFPSDPQAEGNRLAYLAADKATFGLQYTANKGLSSGLECRYVGPRHGDPQNTSPNRMDSYVVADWHGRVPVGHNAFLTLRLDNIFDTAYQDYPGQDQPGRNFMIGAEMTF